MKVFVLNMREEALMPCSCRKARLLLKEKKAKIFAYEPFTIQLLYATGENRQECHLGVDTGSKHIGLAVTSEDKVLYKAEVELRQDIRSNLDTRRSYRRDRRNRKTRYRKPRFENRRRKEGWLPPSLESRVGHTFAWIDRFEMLLPNPKLHIEVGKFDVAKMINPDIEGVEYQQGDTYGYYKDRYYIFARDNYTCQVCGKRGGILRTHHIQYRSMGGSNRVNNQATVCDNCHTWKNHQPGGIFYRWMQEKKKMPQYKEPPFMNALRKRIFVRYPNTYITYGNITTPDRKELGLEKTHYNDAIAITKIKTIRENPDDWSLFRQFRKKKRSLHEATARKGRKTPNRTQTRNAKNKPFYKGFFLNDKVSVHGKVGYITGFTSGGAYIKDKDDNYITLPNKTYKQVGLRHIRRLCHNNNWQHLVMAK